MATTEESAENILNFGKSLQEIIKVICWSSRYTDQDSEFIKNEMDGGEDVYMRAWRDEHHLVIRKYTDSSWSKSFTSHFWTDAPDTSGNILLQVSHSKGDRLLISSNENNGWYFVIARLSGDRIKPIQGGAFITKRFVQSRPITNTEKHMLLSSLD